MHKPTQLPKFKRELYNATAAGRSRCLATMGN